ncbi:36.4 kDa proline-rich protein-like [Phragmites australis]|uniref:36.4 kDa proline-rich protein-like n=1 Tax=Phragmites australis TaxID=29695 RepID=UPI002D799E4E|nr:36.4 kDa proline-rich protein-like [Phragmites australis]
MAAAAAKNHRIVPLLLVAATLIAQLAPAAACPYCPTPKPSPPPPPPPKVKPPPTPVPCPPPPATPTPPSPTPSGKCPINTLKLLACVDALNGLVHAVVGAKASEACCPLLSGVADLDAALCLCTTIKAKALSVSVVLPIAIEVLVNECGKHVPSSFQCS